MAKDETERGKIVSLHLDVSPSDLSLRADSGFLTAGLLSSKLQQVFPKKERSLVKKSKRTQIDGEIYRVHGSEESI